MAHTFNESNLTLNPKEVPGLSAAIVEQSFARPALEKLHRVMTGITMKEQIMLVGQIGRVGLKQSGCGMNASGAGSELSEKYWEPENFGDRFENCIAEMNGLWKAYFDNIQTYAEKFDMQGSELAQLLMVLLEEAISKAILRVAWFGDKDVAAADAATAGLIDANDVKFFDIIDGLWKQIFAGVTATTIAKAELAVTATDSIQAVYDAADSRLRSNTDAMFYVSRSIFDKYTKELRAASLNFELGATVDGLQTVKWNGFEIVNMETIWDNELKAFVNNTTDNEAYLPDRIVFTTRDNIPVGTLNESDLTNLESWYDRKDKKNYTDFGFTIDAKVIEEHMIAVAYGTMPVA